MTLTSVWILGKERRQLRVPRPFVLSRRVKLLGNVLTGASLSLLLNLIIEGQASSHKPVLLSLEVCLISRKLYEVPNPEIGVFLSESSPMHGDICSALLFLSDLWLHIHIGHSSAVLPSYRQDSSMSVCLIHLSLSVYIFLPMSLCWYSSFSPSRAWDPSASLTEEWAPISPVGLLIGGHCFRAILGCGGLTVQLSRCVCLCVLSHVQLFATLWAVAH